MHLEGSALSEANLKPGNAGAVLKRSAPIAGPGIVFPGCEL